MLQPLVKDIAAALGLLTRIPLPRAAWQAGSTPQAAWAWPLAGLVLGLAAALSAGLALALGLAVPLAALLALAVSTVLSGGLHEDGLADCADGFWGGHDRARRLEIMKDSRIGSYGVLALVVVLALRWQAMVLILAAGDWPLLIAAAVLSRAPMAGISAALPNARGNGLSQLVGRPNAITALYAALLALVLALACAGISALGMAICAALAALATAQLARAKIGGQTGDVLGASQQLAEAAALCCASALLG